MRSLFYIRITEKVIIAKQGNMNFIIQDTGHTTFLIPK